MKWFIRIVLLLAVVAVGGFGFWYWHNSAKAAEGYRTAPVAKGDLVVTISATGTLEPEEVVDVGAQVAGQIMSLGEDPQSSSKTIDYGSKVTQTTVLANIDPKIYQTQVDNAKAQVEQMTAQVVSAQAQVEVAQANVQKAQADLQQLNAKVYQTERDWGRAQRLFSNGKGAISDTDYDIARTNFETAKSGLAVGEATLAQNRGVLKDATAAVDKTKGMLNAAKATEQQALANLGYCTIRSPVRGVILDRRVNVGQTVVSSLNAPSLFLIAKDLTRMQIWASVNEADIGQIHAGQPVTFTLDAYPNENFKGEVLQIRLNAQMTQNVVTYTVVITTDNSSGKLLPFLTANVNFEVNRRDNVLTVPNSALRWKPQPEQIAPDARTPDEKPKQRKPSGVGGDQRDRGVVWVAEGAFVRPVPVKVGVSDGTATEIATDKLTEDDKIVVGTTHGTNGGNGATNPFTPQLFGGQKKPGS
jgi:HlyD family secretion protein